MPPSRMAAAATALPGFGRTMNGVPLRAPSLEQRIIEILDAASQIRWKSLEKSNRRLVSGPQFSCP